MLKTIKILALIFLISIASCQDDTQPAPDTSTNTTDNYDIPDYNATDDTNFYTNQNDQNTADTTPADQSTQTDQTTTTNQTTPTDTEDQTTTPTQDTTPTDTTPSITTPSDTTDTTDTIQPSTNPDLSIPDQTTNATIQPLITPPTTTNTTTTTSNGTLQGNYTLHPVNSTLPIIVTSIGKGKIGFTGCNSVSLPFYFQRGIFRLISSPFFSGTRICQTNNDIQYINLLRSANGFRFMGRTCQLTSRGRRIAQFVPYVQRTVQVLPIKTIRPVPVRPVRNVSFRGNFHLNIVGTKISNIPTIIDTSKIAVSGCNPLPISYLARSNGGFQAIIPGPTVVKPCAINNDHQIISKITSGNRFIRNTTGLYLHRGPTLIAIFRPIPVPIPTVVVQPRIPVIRTTSVITARPILTPQPVIKYPVIAPAPVIKLAPKIIAPTPVINVVPVVPPPIIKVTTPPPVVQVSSPIVGITRSVGFQTGSKIGVTKTTTTTSTLTSSSSSSSGGKVVIGSTTSIPSGYAVGIPKPIVFRH